MNNTFESKVLVQQILEEVVALGTMSVCLFIYVSSLIGKYKSFLFLLIAAYKDKKISITGKYKFLVHF